MTGEAPTRLQESTVRLPSAERPDPETRRTRLTDWIADYTERADADGVVVNLSGGLDSTTTATLAVEALGSEAVYGLILPSTLIGATAAQDAEAVCDMLGIQHDTAHLQPLLAQAGEVAPDHIDLAGDPITRGNLAARMRMVFAYLAANAMGRLVVGTTNRSELLLGYYTKYGDGGADFFPLGDCYKTEVRALAREIDVPEPILEKPASAGFRPGQSDKRDLGATYDVIDAILYRFIERDEDRADIEADLDIEAETIDRILHHYEATEHKRAFPPTPSTDPPTRRTDR